jgi:IclR helix-turn-helix domain
MSDNLGNFDIQINDSLRNLGFNEVSIIHKNIVVRLADGRTILSKFKIQDLADDLKKLEGKLYAYGFDENSAQQLITFIVKELLPRVQLKSQDQSSSSTTTDAQKIMQEIEKDRSTIGQISADEWFAEIRNRYQKLHEIVKQKLPNLWHSLEFELSIQKILSIKECTLPFAGIVLGNPSSLKTVGIELFRKWHHTYYTDNFTAKAFVSHSTAIPREALAEIDMLPKIKNKCFLTPELAPTFAAKDEDLIQVLGIMTRILDGHGYESDSGAQGHRGYNEKMMFVWIGAAVDIPYKVHRYLGTLGPKLYFLRLPKVQKSEDDYYKQLDDNFEQNLREIGKALFEYLKWFEIGPDIIVEKDSAVPTMKWDSEKDAEVAKKYIIKLAGLLAHLRGVVATFHTEGTQGTNYGYGMATIEERDRAMTQLYNFARGHALSQGRNYITLEDIPLVVKVVLSTASIERVTIFDLLLAHKGKMTTSQIANSLNISNPTTHRTMIELKALGLVDMKKESEAINSEYQITLDAKFDWFLTKEFLQLREGFVPSNNSEYLNNNKKVVTTTAAAENEREENLPLTNANFVHSNQMHKEKSTLTTSNCDSGKHKEKITNITQKINNNNNRQQVGKENNEVVGGNFSLSYKDKDKEPTFLDVFEELSNDNGNGNGGGLVDYENLRLRLISTGKFFAGDAVMMIEHMEMTGKIEENGFHLYRRKDAPHNGDGNKL